jgi:homoserine dehydrogenase
MSENKKIRFAVIGQGHIGKRHAEMILRNNDSELAAIVKSIIQVYHFIHRLTICLKTKLILMF